MITVAILVRHETEFPAGWTKGTDQPYQRTANRMVAADPPFAIQQFEVADGSLIAFDDTDWRNTGLPARPAKLLRVSITETSPGDPTTSEILNLIEQRDLDEFEFVLVQHGLYQKGWICGGFIDGVAIDATASETFSRLYQPRRTVMATRRFVTDLAAAAQFKAVVDPAKPSLKPAVVLMDGIKNHDGNTVGVLHVNADGSGTVECFSDANRTIKLDSNSFPADTISGNTTPPLV